MGETRKHGLPKKEILRSKKEITNLLANGSRIKGKLCSIYYLPAGERKVIFLVAKRVGKAVRRNKIKRWLREIYRNCRDIIIGNYAVALMISYDNSELSFASLRDEISTSFMKVSQ